MARSKYRWPPTSPAEVTCFSCASSHPDGQPLSFEPGRRPSFAEDPSAAAVVAALAATEAATSTQVAQRLRATESKATSFALHERAVELTPQPSEGHKSVLQGFDEQTCLVKTVNNEDWSGLIQRLQGPRFRTPTSLLPPGCKNMRLYRSAGVASAGLIWDRTRLDLSDAYMWPAGYFAKSEFNIMENGTLMNGRKEALVTLEQLIQANNDLQKKAIIASSNDEKPYIAAFNEILVHVHGTVGMVGVFVRTTFISHMLFAMGIVALLEDSLPGVGELPLFVIDGSHEVQALGRAAQHKLLQEFLRHWEQKTLILRGKDFDMVPRWQVDVRKFGLDLVEQLAFQAAYLAPIGVISAVVERIAELHDRGVVPTRGHVSLEAHAALVFGMCLALESQNEASAKEFVRRVGPLMFLADVGNDDRLPSRADDNYETALFSHVGQQSAVAADICLRFAPFITNHSGVAVALYTLGGKVSVSGVLVGVGAASVLESLKSGQIWHKNRDVRRWLETWLVSASSSFVFRMQSWNAMEPVAGVKPDVASFMTTRAVSDRKHFHHALGELEQCHNALAFIRKLHHLASSLQKPVMRLAMLHHMLGLDDRYGQSEVVEVLAMALQAVSDGINTGSPSRVAGRSACKEPLGFGR